MRPGSLNMTSSVSSTWVCSWVVGCDCWLLGCCDCDCDCDCGVGCDCCDCWRLSRRLWALRRAALHNAWSLETAVLGAGLETGSMMDTDVLYRMYCIGSA